ncbi:hypothetical protein Jab_1c24280 [Janthinobacterium sp. HH01]|uniref:hypothetical protein n=1 Tax=Janthinobacterium sp. HH01 TaxID=1198452 RepID=UPI0002AEBD56|nr:hypothetical protein [Janthinobacterium sp. HH01]ELX13790.1 hypothetical protein Jab_1c24280 [Janthinobacterium sp. HH01]
MKFSSRCAMPVVIWAMACGAVAPAWAGTVDPPITAEAVHAFWWGDFAALEKQNALLRQPGHITADGTSEIELFRTGLNRVIGSGQADREAYLRELEALTLQWAGDHPQSALAHVLHAEVLVSHAWSYRGTGYIHEVPPQALEDFQAYLQRAAKYLADHADVALTDSYAHESLVSIGMGLGWSPAQQRTIAEEGLKRNPEDVGLYFRVVNTMLPKWGGNARMVDQYIRQVTESTKATYGTGMYARLYSYVAQEQYGHALFENSVADWPTMKRSYEDMLVRFPDSPVRRNYYAYMACLAKDTETLRRLLEELGPQVDASKWGPNPQRSLEGCQRLAAKV